MTPLSAFQEKCIGLMNSAPRTHATHCFRSALFHLEQAEQLCKIDPAMAIFRAITAEEEAASGLLRCLAEMDYPNAKYLKEGANKRGNSSRLTQSFHFFMFEPIFSPVNALNQPI